MCIWEGPRQVMVTTSQRGQYFSTSASGKSHLRSMQVRRPFPVAQPSLTPCVTILYFSLFHLSFFTFPSTLRSLLCRCLVLPLSHSVTLLLQFKLLCLLYYASFLLRLPFDSFPPTPLLIPSSYLVPLLFLVPFLCFP